jgi:hypothetical protein
VLRDDARLRRGDNRLIDGGEKHAGERSVELCPRQRHDSRSVVRIGRQ